MKKELFKKMSCFAGISDDTPSPIDDPEYVPAQSDTDNIIREIFAVDPRTGCPMQDIGYYLSTDANPFVKQWLEVNLLKPRASRSGYDPAKVSDDLIAEFSKRSDENAFEYASRLNDIYNEATAELDKQNAE